MAVIQISKIQQRRGQTAQTGFPQLSSGEFGWSIDTQELYIGNGSVTEGAPAVGNTKIITEHNINIFALQDQGYTYGESLPNAVPNVQVRSIQAKLDDIVNLSDFIPVSPDYSSTITEYSGVIQNAVSYAASIGRPLYIPENTDGYVVTATIYISPNTEIRGAGAGKTIIENRSTSTVFQTIDGSGNLYADMSSSANTPDNIRINGLTIKSTLTNAGPIMQLDCVKNSVVEYCTFQGDASTSTQATAINFKSWGGYPSNLTDNVVIKNCLFDKLGSAIVSNYDIANITITENKFNNVDAGVIFGKTLTGNIPQATGPRHIQIANNVFSGVNNQAVYSGSTSTTVPADINSVNNYFYKVGNDGAGDTTSTQKREVIYFGSYGNYSEGDTFDRLTVINTGSTYISSSTLAIVKPVISGPVILKSKSPSIYTITGAGDSQPMFGYPRTTYQYGTNALTQTITMDYTLVKSTVTRRGKVEIIVSGTTATVRDDFTFTGPNDGGITFYAEVKAAKGLVILFFNNTPGTGNGTIEYTYTVKQ